MLERKYLRSMCCLRLSERVTNGELGCETDASIKENRNQNALECFGASVTNGLQGWFKGYMCWRGVETEGGEKCVIGTD